MSRNLLTISKQCVAGIWTINHLFDCPLHGHPLSPPHISLIYQSIASYFIKLKLLRNVLQLIVTANVVPSSLILSTLMM
jgi:hypothetical protein